MTLRCMVSMRWLALVALLSGAWAGVQPARADVDLVWGDRPQTVAVGVEFELGLYARSTLPIGQDEAIVAMDVVLTWDHATLQLIGVHDNEPPIWMSSGFFQGTLNASLNDGNAKYTALSNFGAANRPKATPDGLLVTSFRFVALTVTPSVDVVIVPSMGSFNITTVFGETSPSITGTLGVATIAIVAPADCGADGTFDLRDFQRLQRCYTDSVVGRGIGDPPTYSTDPVLCCGSYDYDDDGDIDAGDHEFFTSLFTPPLQ